MGCCSSRNYLTDEDKFVALNERRVVMESSPALIEMTFKKWIGPDGLNQARLKKVFATLNVMGNELDKLMVEFKNGESFNVNELISFCVFMTCAKPQDKAAVWFDLLDTGLKNQLTYGQVKDFLEQLFKFTFKFLPRLAAGNEMTEECVEIYINSCYKMKTSFIDKHSILVCPEHTLDKEIFVSQLQIYYTLTYSEGIRTLLRKLSK